MATLLVTGANLLGSGAQDLLIEDGVITEVGSIRSAKGADVLDADGLVAPPTLMPSGITAWAAADGFELSHDFDAVLPEVDAVMMLRVQRERMSGGFFPTAREYTVGYGLTRARLEALTAANPAAVICHPGPMNRGLEIAADAADAAQSVVLEQVSSGLAVRMAVLYHLLAGEES